MRKLFFSLLIGVFALGLAGGFPQAHAQEGLALQCSAPVNEAVLGVFPSNVVVWFTEAVDTVEGTVVNAAGDVVSGDITVDGAMATVALNADALTADTVYTVELTATNANGSATESLTFTVAANALQIPDAEIVNDCPADMGGETPEETATPEETVVPEETEAPEETATPEETETPEETTVPEETATEVVEPTVGDPLTLDAGSTVVGLNMPVAFVSKSYNAYFLFPVTVVAADADTADAYVDEPDNVPAYVIIITSFTSADLDAFGLEAGATGQDIIAALIRPDSSPSEAEEVTVAGAPALKVSFTNEASGKSGEFYLVSFAGAEEATNYLLIQGSSASAEWEANAANFQLVVGGIVEVLPEE